MANEPPPPVDDLYKRLKCARTATPEVIKAAYRKAAMKHHPDKGGKPEEFAKVQFAYDVLSDPDRRKLYDETGTAEPKKADNAEAGAMELVTMGFKQIVDELIAFDQQKDGPSAAWAAAIGASRIPISLNGAMERFIQDQLARADGEIKASASAIKTLERVQKKTRRRDGAKSFLHVILEQQLIGHRANVSRHSTNKATILAAAKIIKEHDFDDPNYEMPDMAAQLFKRSSIFITNIS